MYVIQHQSQLRWDKDVWNLIARHDSLDRCVVGIKRICDEPGRNPDHYRIVKVNARGKVVETFDAKGKQIDGFIVPAAEVKRLRKRALATA